MTPLAWLRRRKRRPHVELLRFQVGDRLVITMDHVIDPEEADYIRRGIEEVFGEGVGVLVLSPGASLSVIRQDETQGNP